MGRMSRLNSTVFGSGSPSQSTGSVSSSAAQPAAYGASLNVAQNLNTKQVEQRAQPTANNNVNVSNPNAVLGSRLFNVSNSLQGGPFSQGSSANRRIELQATFAF